MWKYVSPPARCTDRSEVLVINRSVDLRIIQASLASLGTWKNSDSPPPPYILELTWRHVCIFSHPRLIWNPIPSLEIWFFQVSGSQSFSTHTSFRSSKAQSLEGGGSAQNFFKSQGLNVRRELNATTRTLLHSFESRSLGIFPSSRASLRSVLRSSFHFDEFLFA